ncbi:transporter substrate-binding domain-containing protein [Escherichia coli]
MMAGMDITPEREKQVLFTTPYYDNSACLWVAKANTPVLIS